jgi:tetratricopeptide (TPR) repeat protein
MAVRASFQVSFASLPTSTQPDGVTPADAFRMLGLWHGPSISSAAAAALFGIPEYLAEDALEALVDAHLLESTSRDRYKFHDLLRVYSSERAVADLSEPDRDAALGRLLGWYMRTTDAAASAVSSRHRYNIPLDPGDDVAPLTFASAEESLAWNDSERANIVAATRQASSRGLHEVAWRLPAPLFGIFNASGNLADLVVTHRIALDSARRVGNRQGEAWLLNNLGEALGFIGDSDSIDYLERAQAIRREIGDRRGEAQAANNLADAYQKLGRTEEAVKLLRLTLDLNREVGYRFGEGIALGNLGSTLLELDRAEEALDYLLEAHRAFTETDYADGLAYVLHILGRCYATLRRDADALDCLQQALASHRATGNRPRQAATLKSLGSVQKHFGLTAEARESWSLAAAIFDDLGDSAQAEQVRAEQGASGIS